MGDTRFANKAGQNHDDGMNDASVLTRSPGALCGQPGIQGRPPAPIPGPPLSNRGLPRQGGQESPQGRSELTRLDLDCSSLGVASTPCRARGLGAPLPS